MKHARFKVTRVVSQGMFVGVVPMPILPVHANILEKKLP